MDVGHGVPMALSLAQVREGAGLRGQLEWASGLGYRGVGLWAAHPESRPRELGRSARRDLAATLRRHELALACVELWVPMEHFGDGSLRERAVEALLAAVDLSAEVAGLAGGEAVLATALPGGEAGDEIAGVLASRASAVGGRVADCVWPAREGVADPSGLGLGFDPAVVLASEGSGADVVTLASSWGGRCAAARVTDLTGAGRVEPGTGRLDVGAYLAALSVAGYRGWATVDLRGLEDQGGAAGRVLGRGG